MGSRVVGKWVVANAVEIDYVDGAEVFRADMFALSGAYLEFNEGEKGSVYDGEGNVDAFTYTATKENLLLKYIESNDVTIYHIKELTGSTLSVYEEHIETQKGIVHKEVVEIKLMK